MKIAVTCENHQVFQHFGHTPAFAIFEVENNAVVAEEIMETGDSGHGALAALLAEKGVNVLICGGIGAGAIAALGEAQIKVTGGASGDVKTVVEAYLAGTLKVRPNFHCMHHHHGEGHTCGDHKH